MIELTENAITHLKNLTEKNKKNYVLIGSIIPVFIVQQRMDIRR